MKITKVKYSRLVSGDNFSNQNFGAEAEVLEGENPKDVRADLVLWVDDILEKRGLLREEADAIQTDINELATKKYGLEREVDELREKHKWLVEFLKSHNIDTEKCDIPF